MAKHSQEQQKKASLLLSMQEIDLELVRIQELLKNPTEVQKLKKTYALAKKVDARLTALKGRRKDIEMTINELDAEQKHLMNALTELQEKAQSASTDYRSQANFRDHYASLAKKLEKSEFSSDAIMGELEVIEAQEAKLKHAKEQAAQEVRAQTRIAKAQVSAMQKSIAQLQAQRNELARALDAQSLTAYEQALKRSNGLAVETLEGSRPSVCRVSLTTAALEDAQKSGPVTQCPYCRRILIVEKGGPS